MGKTTIAGRAYGYITILNEKFGTKKRTNPISFIIFFFYYEILPVELTESHYYFPI